MDIKQTGLFIGYRFLMTLSLLILFPTVVFALLEAVPGDMAVTMLGERANPETIAQARDELGLDDPLTTRYLNWMGDSLIHRDFGTSLRSNQPAYKDFTDRLSASLELLLPALYLSLYFGLPLGFLAAMMQKQIPDVLFRYGLLMVAALPIFWLAMILILQLGVERDWLPLAGRCPASAPGECSFSERIDHMILPITSMVIFWGSAVAFMTRSFLVDFAEHHHERSEPLLIGSPLAMLAALPVIVTGMMSSLVLVETVFAWPGIGRLLANAVFQRDFPTISAVITMSALAAAVIYFLSMLIYAIVCMVLRVQPDGYAVNGQFPLQAIAEQQQFESPQPERTVIPRKAGMIFSGIALLILLIIVGVVSFPGLITDADPNEASPPDRLLPIGSDGYPLGTDILGRDMQARLLAGGSDSLEIASNAAAFSLVIGLFLGVIGGAFDGIPGSILNVPLNWIMLPFNIMPLLMLLLLVLLTVDRASNETIIWAMALLGWTNIPPLVRARLRSLRRRKLYVIPETTDGMSFMETPIWNMMISPVLMVVYFFAVNTAFFLLVETALSFLGLGVQPPEASWGNMLSDSLRYMRDNSHLVYVPGAAIALTIACLMIVAENIRSTFDFTA